MNEMSEMNGREISARTNSFGKADEVVFVKAETSVISQQIVFAAQTGDARNFVNEPRRNAPLKDLSSTLSSSVLKDLSNALLKDGDCDCSWFAGNAVAVQNCSGCERGLRLFCDAPLHWRGRHWHLRCAFEDARELAQTAATLRHSNKEMSKQCPERYSSHNRATLGETFEQQSSNVGKTIETNAASRLDESAEN